MVGGGLCALGGRGEGVSLSGRCCGPVDMDLVRSNPPHDGLPLGMGTCIDFVGSAAKVRSVSDLQRQAMCSFRHHLVSTGRPRAWVTDQ